MKEFRFEIDLQRRSAGRFIRFGGSPLVLLLVAFVLAATIYPAFLLAKCTADLYFPYRGKVLAVEGEGWFEWFVTESGGSRYLRIENEEGGKSRKFVRLHDLYNGRIRAGDYVVKNRGFGEGVRVPGKKTAAELRDAFRD